MIGRALRSVRRGLKWFVPYAPGLIRGGYLFGGLALLTIGAGRIYGPAGYLVLGFGLFAVGYRGLPRL